MAYHEVLMMAMTRMRSGICTAGYINQQHPGSGLQWVRPVKEHGSLLLGDMSDASHRVIQIGDVIELNLLRPRPDPVHAEDWLTDFVKHRPRLLRQLTGEKRADFLRKYVDVNPADVLTHHRRSLCLVHPQMLWSAFSLDDYSGKYDARIGFELAGLAHARANSPRGLPVTDLKWRALGRDWLSQDNRNELNLNCAALHQRLSAEAIYLTIGLSRTFQGDIWPLIVGVYPIPDYTAVIDYDNL